MKALFHLPANLKDQVFPVVVARPWPNAKHLMRTFEKIDEAFNNRRYALDLDIGKRGVPSSNPASGEFDALFSPHHGHEAYYDLCADIPFAVPVLRSNDRTSAGDLRAELDRVDALDRGLVVRAQKINQVDVLALVRRLVDQRQEFVLVLDVGWSRDLLDSVAWVSGWLRAINDFTLNNNAAEIEIVVAGSSFPESFTNVGPRRSIEALERQMFDQVVVQYNRLNITYGDWASSRPPREPTPMTPVPRIDLPLSREWICFRQTEDEDYPDIARRVVSDATWDPTLTIWGTYTIDATASELPGMIRSPQTATAARMNIHMFKQASFDAAGIVGDGDEPFIDE